MEVHSGVLKLEELIDVIKYYRENWKTAEREKETSKALESVRKSRNDCDIFTPVSSLNNKGVSSPAENRPEKRPKGKSADTIRFK